MLNEQVKLTKNLINNQLFLISFLSLFSCLSIFIFFQLRPQELFICDVYKTYVILYLEMILILSIH